VCHTILVADRLADADARLIVGVLKDHDLGQINSQTVTDIVSVVCAAACWAIMHASDGMARSFSFARARGVNDDRGSKVEQGTRKDLPASDQLSQLRMAAASQELYRVGSHVVLCCVNFLLWQESAMNKLAAKCELTSAATL
jgi:hypothetical protein